MTSDPQTLPSGSAGQELERKQSHIVKQLHGLTSAYGSHFLLMAVSPLGHVQVYASDALAPKTTTWVSQEVRQQASDLALDSLEDRKPVIDVKPKIALKHSRTGSGASPSVPLLKPPRTRNRAPSPDSELSPVKTPSPPLSPKPKTSITFHSEDDLLQFYMQQFSGLHQDLCKRLAKQWIKLFEPTKCVKYPYQRGDSSKPPWWPTTIRHERPDHLLKHERSHLLGAILLMHIVPVSTLEESASMYSSALPPVRLDLLSELYAVATQDEELRRGNNNHFVPFEAMVASTLSRSITAELAKSSSTDDPKSPQTPRTPTCGIKASPQLTNLGNSLNKSRKRARDATPPSLNLTEMLSRSSTKRMAVAPPSAASYEPMNKSLAMSIVSDAPRPVPVPAPIQQAVLPPQQYKHYPHQPLVVNDAPFSASQFVPQLDENPFSFHGDASMSGYPYMEPADAMRTAGYYQPLDASMGLSVGSVGAFDWS